LLAFLKAVATIRSDLSARGEKFNNNAEVPGRLTESLGGVRVEQGLTLGAREEAVFAVACAGFSIT